MTDHTHFITQALGLAAQALFLSNPNPRVGCVITAPDGQVLGQGFTQQAGGPHAEVMALRDAAAKGHDVGGATAYVTLEPCSHHGRTPPCTDAIVAAGIAMGWVDATPATAPTSSFTPDRFARTARPPSSLGLPRDRRPDDDAAVGLRPIRHPSPLAEVKDPSNRT